MSTMFCQYEEEIVQAAFQNRLTTTMEQHLHGCAPCRSAIAIAKQMQAVRMSGLSEVTPIPHPQVIWLKAQYMQKKKRTRFDLLVSASVLCAVLFFIYLLSAFLAPSGSAFSLVGLFHGFTDSKVLTSPLIIIVCASILVLFLGRTSSNGISFRRI